MAENYCNKRCFLHGFSLAVGILTLLLGIWICLEAVFLGILVILLGSILTYGVLQENAECIIIYVVANIVIILSLLMIPLYFIIWSVSFRKEAFWDDVFNIKNLAVGVCIDVVLFLVLMVVFLHYKEVAEKKKLEAKKLEVKRPLTV